VWGLRFLFRKYLLKHKFWALPQKGKEEPCYMKHDDKVGGVYAYILKQGVRIKINDNSQVFTNFNELNNFLQRVQVQSQKSSTFQYTMQNYLEMNNLERIQF
jgi:hypothetical protein